MLENKYLVRTPLLDPKQQVVGYKLAWQKNEKSSELLDEEELHQLQSLVTAHFSGSRLGLLFMEASPVALSEKALQSMSPQTTVLILKRSELADANSVARAVLFREQGFALAIGDADLAFLQENELLLSHTAYVLIDFGHPDLTAITNFAKFRKSPFVVVVDKIPSWHEFDVCAGLGTHGVFENLCLAPHKMGSTAQLGPQAKQILLLMQMVQDNADIRQIEKILKSDVTLSYKLLRYINSAGFGLNTEIESPRHAVAMLGYAPLFRWLVLLLARTNSTSFSPALMQAAMVRGRFAELLGQGFFTKKEAENLFTVGMFSFLDHLLGIPIEEVLGQLMLPEAVTQALLSRAGEFGRVLALAEASEQGRGCASDVAKALSMTSAHVNQAHLSALAWAHNIEL